MMRSFPHLWTVALAIVWWSLLSIACYVPGIGQRCNPNDPNFDIATCPCSTSQLCPNGFACQDGRCQRDDKRPPSDGAKEELPSSNDATPDTTDAEPRPPRERPTLSEASDAGNKDAPEPDVVQRDTRPPDVTKDDGAPACSEGVKRPCYPGKAGTANVGLCKPGTELCSQGKWQACQGAVVPTAESCDGKDNDCDGAIDNITPKSCYTGPANTKNKGNCKAGTQQCSQGQWSTCQGQVLPEGEKCNKADDDCDGNVDEGDVCKGCTPGTKQPCGNGKGACVQGSQTCQSDRTWGNCTGAKGPTSETCNKIDDDCDGSIDDGLSRSCRNNCGTGRETCSNGVWKHCTAPTPTTETCNKRDDDCDGSVDEDFPNKGKSCQTGLQGPCSTGKTLCVNGKESCQSDVQPTTETCNGRDDNCNGQVDEGNPGGGTDCPIPGRMGVCAQGSTNCNSRGRIVCVATSQTPSASPETCNGLDDNCDGDVDEGNPGGGAACNVPQKAGPCRQGVEACSGGKIICKQVIFPATEVCGDTVDKNCNGSVGICKPGSYKCFSPIFRAPCNSRCDGWGNPDYCLGNTSCDFTTHTCK